MLILGCVLTCTTTLYWYSTPESLQEGLGVSRGYWGTFDSEFNWCEKDYVVSEYVAEWWNTWTSLWYVVACVVGFRLHSLEELGVPTALALGAVGPLGFGSAAFHGTLRYSMQLTDEIPLYSVILLTVYALLHRHDKAPSWQRWVTWAAMAVVAGPLLLTPRHSVLHEFSRGFMTYAFSVALILMFVLVGRAGKEIARELQNRGMAEAETAFGRMADQSFLFMVAGELLWITDIFGCGALRELPYGLPYPHLHSFGWHGCTTIVVFQIVELLVLHRALFCRRTGAAVVIKHLLPFGLVPYVASAEGTVPEKVTGGGSRGTRTRARNPPGVKRD